MLLKFKKTDQFGHPVFSTHGLEEGKQAEKRLVKLAQKLSVAKHNPVWVSEEHGTCLVTCRDLDRDLVPGGTYNIKLDPRLIEQGGQTYANIWLKRCDLVSLPDLGEEIDFDSDSD